jgi:hypothetical protein
MSREQLIVEIKKLRLGIRMHRDSLATNCAHLIDSGSRHPEVQRRA